MTDVVKVDVRRDGRRFEADAVLDLSASAQTVWDTITDYDALPGFMPGIRHCRVIQRRQISATVEHLEVEQQGEFRFLMFAQAMTVHLNIEHERLRVAQAKASSFELGMFRRSAIDVFEGRYELVPPGKSGNPLRTQLRYSAVIGLRLPPPPAVGTLAVRQNLAAQLEALAAEIARRSRKLQSAAASV
jgi:hypothetical protein